MQQVRQKFITKAEFDYFAKVYPPNDKLIIKPIPVKEGLIIKTNLRSETKWEARGVVLQIPMNNELDICVGDVVNFSLQAMNEAFTMTDFPTQELYQSLPISQILFVDRNIKGEDFLIDEEGV